MTTWDYMTNMWFSCSQSSPIDWSFPNGTLVTAASYDDALDSLQRYTLSRNNVRVQQTEQGLWTVQFGYNIFITVKAQNHNEAIQRASWKFYLDKREARC